MNRIIIIGCGFAGASCSLKLAGYASRRQNTEITVIEPKSTMDFLPMLPDIIGRGLSAGSLSFDTGEFLERIGCTFVNERVIALDLEKREVSTDIRKLYYDYVVISSGSQTNFYGNDEFKKAAYKLDNVIDMRRIKSALRDGLFANYLVCGGGYTGIEVATNLRCYLDKISRQGRIIIVERAPSILGPLPEWMKDFVRKNLEQMHIEVITGDSIGKLNGNDIYLGSGKSFNDAMLIWSAGVKTADFIQQLNHKKNSQGRLEVDEYLRLDDRTFAVGDTAMVKYKNAFLRMAVQFSIVQGKCAAANIIRSIDKLPLRPYRPRDLGYIIPMANNRSCGIVMGVKVRGLLATVLHYLMCVYRTTGLKNKLGIIKDLISGGEK